MHEDDDDLDEGTPPAQAGGLAERLKDALKDDNPMQRGGTVSLGERRVMVIPQNDARRAWLVDFDEDMPAMRPAGRLSASAVQRTAMLWAAYRAIAPLRDAEIAKAGHAEASAMGIRCATALSAISALSALAECQSAGLPITAADEKCDPRVLKYHRALNAYATWRLLGRLRAATKPADEVALAQLIAGAQQQRVDLDKLSGTQSAALV